MYVKYFTSLCGKNKTMESISKIVGQNIKEARKIKGLTQKEVAQVFRMTQQQYSRFENGVFELNYQQILDICKLLNTTPNEIFGFNI
jgi:transcriptional regulator with XRE-family HTH domain